MNGARVEFEPEGHVYRIDGMAVPSVTQLLAPLEDFSGIPRDTLEAARVFGQHVHQACHLHNRGELDMDSLDPLLVPYVQGYIKFLDDTGATVVGSEVVVASSIFGYAGTMDLDAVLRRKRWTIDIKSSDGVPPTVGPQTAAYERAFVERFGGKKWRHRACLHLKRNAYRFYELKDGNDWSTFLSCRNIHIWRQRNAA